MTSTTSDRRRASRNPVVPATSTVEPAKPSPVQDGLRGALSRPVFRALLQASGCSVVTDQSGPFFRVWVMDADRNEVAVRRSRDFNAVTDWLLETLLARPVSPSATAHAFAVRH